MSQDLASLVSLLSSEDINQQRSAAQQLMNDPQVATASVELAIAVGSDDEILVEHASAALEGIESVSLEQAQELAQLLPSAQRDCASNTAYWVATLLGRQAEQAAPFVTRLVDAIDAVDEDFVKQRLVWAISKIGPQASEASGQLQQIADGSDQRLARLANQALESIRG